MSRSLPRLPCLDLAGYSASAASADLTAALTVLFLAIPQGIAYATIAELPPAMGLYASAIPTLIGGLFRSSRHVVAGPSNALSLLVGGALAVAIGDAHGVSPVVAATTLAVMVGVLQVLSGVLRLSALADFISRPVVLGYITGAALLIAVGQLHNLTGTTGGRGMLWPRVQAWWAGLDAISPVALAMAGAVAGGILALRRLKPRWPVAMVALSLGTLVSWLADLPALGLRLVGDISPVPSSLPPLTLPELSLVGALLPAAFAAMVLSLVESTAVGRAIATRTGQRLVAFWDFVGMGLANISAGLTGGYPVSGSLSRSALNERAGAVTRMGAVYGGLFMLLTPLAFAGVFNLIPVAALAGLLVVVAGDLVDRARIIVIMRSTWGDRLAFTLTCVGTWVLPLDQAIYLGVGSSLVKVLYNARRLDIDVAPTTSACTIVSPRGAHFFGVEEVIRDGLVEVLADREGAPVVLAWMANARGMDVSVGTLWLEVAQQLRAQGRVLCMAGLSEAEHAVLVRSGLAEQMGADRLRRQGPDEGAQPSPETIRWAEAQASTKP
ncbi:MAG: SulP family inorganic anion transporter [Bradymonadia bacterium]